MKIKNKKILIIIGGGISAYKSLDLIRFLKKDGYEVKTVLTRSGKQFVTPLSIVSLSGGNVYENLFDKDNEADIATLLGSWSDHYNFWTKKNSNLLLIKYEDLILDTKKELERIIIYLKKFMTVEINPEKITH